MRHSLGRIVATAAVAASVPQEVIFGLLDRHAARDWGDIDGEDKAANDADHSHAEGRLFSSYDNAEHGTIWMITEDLLNGVRPCCLLPPGSLHRQSRWKGFQREHTRGPDPLR